MKEVPEREAVLGLIIAGDRILLLQTDSKWCLPGGVMLPDESLGDALSRNIYRDVGIEKLEGPEYLKLYELNHKKSVLYKIHAFRIEKEFPFSVALTDECSEIFFATQEEALSFELADTVTRAIIEGMYD